LEAFQSLQKEQSWKRTLADYRQIGILRVGSRESQVPKKIGQAGTSGEIKVTEERQQFQDL
jgi:hypothetical protein